MPYRIVPKFYFLRARIRFGLHKPIPLPNNYFSSNNLIASAFLVFSKILMIDFSETVVKDIKDEEN